MIARPGTFTSESGEVDLSACLLLSVNVWTMELSKMPYYAFILGLEVSLKFPHKPMLRCHLILTVEGAGP